MLELRPNCEMCDRDLPPDDDQARICSYECTFCATPYPPCHHPPRWNGAETQSGRHQTPQTEMDDCRYRGVCGKGQKHPPCTALKLHMRGLGAAR